MMVRALRGGAVVVAASVAVTGLCLAGPVPAWAVFSGQNGLIAYTSVTSDHPAPSIHTVLPDGQGDTVIAPDGGELAWSPNGRRIAFIRFNGPGDRPDIYTMRANGTDVKRLTFDGGNWGASYSPHGGRIVFWHESPRGRTKIVRMRSNGKGGRRVLRHRGMAPTWSPDGKIAFIWRRPGAERRSIWTMRRDGTHKHRLVALGKRGGYGPMYSPDASEFMFVRFGRSLLGAVTWLADADGSNVRKHPCGVLARGTARGKPAFGHLPITYSPDGRSVLTENSFDDFHRSLVRLSLDSCTGERVVGGFGGAAAWQALPVP